MKRLTVILIAMFMAVMPVRSQILIVSEDEFSSNSRNTSDAALGVMVPGENMDIDQFVPVGEALLLMTGLAGAYLLGKKKSRREE